MKILLISLFAFLSLESFAQPKKSYRKKKIDYRNVNTFCFSDKVKRVPRSSSSSSRQSTVHVAVGPLDSRNTYVAPAGLSGYWMEAGYLRQSIVKPTDGPASVFHASVAYGALDDLYASVVKQPLKVFSFSGSYSRGYRFDNSRSLNTYIGLALSADVSNLAPTNSAKSAGYNFPSYGYSALSVDPMVGISYQKRKWELLLLAQLAGIGAGYFPEYQSVGASMGAAPWVALTPQNFFSTTARAQVGYQLKRVSIGVLFKNRFIRSDVKQTQWLSLVNEAGIYVSF